MFLRRSTSDPNSYRLPLTDREMGRKVYVSDTGAMEDRVKRNRHFHQRDLGSESFLKRT